MPLILLVIVVLFNWKLTLTNQFTWLEDPDRANQVLPWFQFQAIQWHGFRIPAWDPNEWIGQPLFGQGQPGSAYPFNWLLFLMPMSMGAISMAALNWYFVLIRYIAMLGGYALCRDLKCSREASVLGACVFGLGGFVANTGWPQMVNGAVWAPLVFLFLFRVDKGEHRVANSLLSGFFLGFAWLSGHHQAPLYITLAAICVWIRMVFRGTRVDLAVIRLAALSLLIALCASALQTFPMAEYGSRSVRWVGTADPIGFNETTPYFIHAQNSLKPVQLLSVFLPVPSLWNPFIGIVALAFAGLGAMLAWGERHVRWLAAVALGGLLYSLGPNGLLHGVFYAIVPMVEKARSPAAAIILFALGIAPLTAIGVDRLMTSGRGPALNSPVLNSDVPRLAARVIAGFGAILGLASIGFFAAGVNPAISDTRMMTSAVCAVAAAALIAASRRGGLSRGGCAAAAVFVVLFELSNVTNYYLAERGQGKTPLLDNLKKHGDIAHFLSTRGDFGRIEYQETDIPYNFGDWFGLETFQSYTASVTSNIWQHDVFKLRVRDILGIRYAIAKQPTLPSQHVVFTGASGLSVYENPEAYPRVWAVHESLRLSNPSDAGARLLSAAFDARKTVFFTEPSAPQLAPCGNDSGSLPGDDVRLTLHGTNRVAISATLICPGMVILTDTFYPGWRAKLDGNTVAIVEADGVFRGVAVPAGRHVIEMQYRPASVIGGGLLSLLAALTAAAAFVRIRR